MPAPAETLKISEIFHSLQGEGTSAGTPAMFVRLAHCNLRCVWCDTKYSWDFVNHRYEDEVREVPVEELVALIDAAPSQRLVLTGGEPLLQQRSLSRLFTALSRSIFVEVETNGTVEPDPLALSRVDQWNVSAKLSSAGDAETQRIRLHVLATFRELDHAYLKLVVREDADYAEADALTARLAWPAERVLLMPEAQDRATLNARSPAVADAARRRGMRFSSRLHLELWDGRRGT